MKNNTLAYRVGELEKNYDKLDEKLDKLMTNDLPHLHQSMASLKTRIDVLTLVNVGAIVIAVILNKFL